MGQDQHCGVQCRHERLQPCQAQPQDWRWEGQGRGQGRGQGGSWQGEAGEAGFGEEREEHSSGKITETEEQNEIKTLRNWQN